VLLASDLLDEQEIIFEMADGRVERFVDRSEIFSAQVPPRFGLQLVVYAAHGRKREPEMARRAEETALRLLTVELDGVAK
jgi:hypothetical protein